MILSYDGRNAFDNMFRSKILLAVSIIAPDLVGYARNLYGRSPPKLLCRMENISVQEIHSLRDVQQGCGLRSLCYSTGSLETLRQFEEAPPVPGAEAMAFINDIVVVLPPE